jgi:hypothetical protein
MRPSCHRNALSHRVLVQVKGAGLVSVAGGGCERHLPAIGPDEVVVEHLTQLVQIVGIDVENYTKPPAGKNTARGNDDPAQCIPASLC